MKIWIIKLGIENENQSPVVHSFYIIPTEVPRLKLWETYEQNFLLTSWLNYEKMILSKDDVN